MLPKQEQTVLMLIKNHPDDVSQDSDIFALLLQKGLVTVDCVPAGAKVPRITNQGRAALGAGSKPPLRRGRPPKRAPDE